MPVQIKLQKTDSPPLNTLIQSITHTHPRDSIVTVAATRLPRQFTIYSRSLVYDVQEHQVFWEPGPVLR
jgi:hypothetical protein